jgi:cytochrome c oxidase assembly protein subunit 15
MTEQVSGLPPDAAAPSAARGGGDSQISRLAAIWLVAVAALVLAMVVVGGATRVTGSGLSITQWKPVSGAIPPLSHSAWQQAFQLYQATPQYLLLNRGMTLAQFQTIYWWEWAHRLLGRLLGLAFFAPFLVLVALRRLPRRLIWRCALLFALGGLQGLVGWWMVKSGLEARTSVAPERLAAHLGLALLLFAALVWTALEAWFGPSEEGTRPRSPGWLWASALFFAAVFLQCLLGALAAGNHAGLIDADWPLMAGKAFPADYWRGSLWASLAHNPSAVQFNHRVLAYGLLAAGLVMGTAALRQNASPLRYPTLGLAGLLFIQVGLGVAALILTVPLALAMAHQLTAVALVGVATMLAWRARRY